MRNLRLTRIGRIDMKPIKKHRITGARVEVLSRSAKKTKVRFLSAGNGRLTGVLDAKRFDADFTDDKP